MTILVMKSIDAVTNQLSWGNRVRYSKANTKKWKKGCFTAFLDASLIFLVALTEHGEGAEPPVGMVKGCEEFLCSIFCPKQLHLSQTKTIWWHIFKQLKPNQGLDKLPTTQEYLVRTHPSPTGPDVIFRHRSPGITILYIKCNYHWLYVLTLVISCTHSYVQTRLFHLQEHMREHLLVDSTLLDPPLHRMN